MILLKKFSKKIPSFRHKTDIQLFDNDKIAFSHKSYHKNIKTINLIKRKKIIYKSFNYNLHCLNSTNFNLIVKCFSYQFKPYKKIIICQTLDNISYNIPGIDLLNPGQVLFAHNNFKFLIKNFCLRGFSTLLWKLPINTICSNISNYNNTKITFSKSSGTFCKLKKNKKSKKKLLLIELPSKQEKLLTKNTKIFVGKNQNFRTNELVEGKWGFGFSLKKKINVRGVAMNPVDHPNGGRTKTVQPERSPWNWVAKKKK